MALSNYLRRDNDYYHVSLPTSGLHSPSNGQSYRIRRRNAPAFIIIMSLIMIFSLAWIFYSPHDIGTMTRCSSALECVPQEVALPPLFERYHEDELRLPQHIPDLPPPEGRHGKYLWAPNHVWESGWGNAMQEHLLNSHLAYLSGRAYVFDNYTWNRDGSDYSRKDGKLIPSRIPMTAFIAGPVVGGAFPPGDPAPRFVTPEYFSVVCPDTTIIRTEDVIRYLDPEVPASEMLQTWLDRLSTESNCVEIARDSYQIFGIWLFGSARRLLSIWPSLSTSPVLTHFAWSPLVRSAFLANHALFTPSSAFPALPHTGDTAAATSEDAPLPGLLALHLRRGDFADHCAHLAHWNTSFMGFNSFASLHDKFEPPRVPEEERRTAYAARCFPDIPQVVEKVREVRREVPGIRNVYVMTNGEHAWVAELEAALRAMPGGWDRVASGRDMVLSAEQQYVAQAIDMMIGQRAQVFIGNGFSSLTSNVVMLRMARGLDPSTVKFW